MHGRSCIVQEFHSSRATMTRGKPKAIRKTSSRATLTRGRNKGIRKTNFIPRMNPLLTPQPWEHIQSPGQPIGMNNTLHTHMQARPKSSPTCFFDVVGFLPSEVGHISESSWRAFIEAASKPNVVAIGETGIDENLIGTNMHVLNMQKNAFLKQAQLAMRLSKPLIINYNGQNPVLFVDFLEVTVVQTHPILWRGFAAAKCSGTQINYLSGKFPNMFFGFNRNFCLYDGAVVDKFMFMCMFANIPKDRLILDFDAPPESQGSSQALARFIAEAWSSVTVYGPIIVTANEVLQRSSENAAKFFGMIDKPT